MHIRELTRIIVVSLLLQACEPSKSSEPSERGDEDTAPEEGLITAIKSAATQYHVSGNVIHHTENDKGGLYAYYRAGERVCWKIEQLYPDRDEPGIISGCGDTLTWSWWYEKSTERPPFIGSEPKGND